MAPAPALLARFAADGSVVDSNSAAAPSPGDDGWGADHLEALASRWATFGPAVLDGPGRTFVWELGDRSLITAAGRVQGEDSSGVVVVLVETATIDITEIRSGRSDPLTGLAGRGVVVDRLADVVRSFRHAPSPVGVAVVTLGHEVGPSEMVEAAERLEQTVRGGDHVGRIGDDELAVVFGTTISETEAGVAAARFLQVLGAHRDVHVGLAFSVQPVSATALLDEAEAAVDLARRAGTRVYAVDDDDRGALEWTRRRVDELRVAIELDQFEVRYQPVVALDGGAVTSVEALVRWQHPTDGLVLPDSFVPLAERTGLIGQVTGRVLGHVLADLGRWGGDEGDAALADLPVAVNMSATDLLGDGFVDRLSASLVDAAISPRRLRLELTETSVLADPSRAIDVIGALRSAGLGVSLDDFGTGASTLAVLRDLPVDCLKIDQSFVAGLPESDGDLAVARLIVGLARELGLSVIAEGIETTGQLEALAGLGCTSGQGYLFSPALAAADLATFLRERAS